MTDQSTLANPFFGIRDDVFNSEETPDEQPENEVPEEETPEEEIPEETESQDEAEEIEAEAAPEEESEEAEEAEESEGEGATEESADEAEHAETVIDIKFYGESEKFDLLADPDETRRLIQQGKDYDKKTGINDAIAKKLVRYDYDSGGLVPGEAFDQAKFDGAKVFADKLTELGVLVAGAAGPELAPAVQQALNTPQVDPTHEASAKVAELEKQFDEDNSVESWKAWQEAKIEHEMERRFQTRDQTQRKAQETASEAEQIRRALAQAETNIETKANDLKKLFTGPSGTFDEAAWKRELGVAKRLMKSRDSRNHYQYEAAMRGLDEAAQLYARRTNKTVKATTNRRKPAKKATRTPTGRPATGKAAQKSKDEVKFDPSQPFAHIPNPETS